jgi:hypothetical protein
MSEPHEWIIHGKALIAQQTSDLACSNAEGGAWLPATRQPPIPAQPAAAPRPPALHGKSRPFRIATQETNGCDEYVVPLGPHSSGGAKAVKIRECGGSMQTLWRSWSVGASGAGLGSYSYRLSRPSPKLPAGSLHACPSLPTRHVHTLLLSARLIHPSALPPPPCQVRAPRRLGRRGVLPGRQRRGVRGGCGHGAVRAAAGGAGWLLGWGFGAGHRGQRRVQAGAAPRFTAFALSRQRSTCAALRAHLACPPPARPPQATESEAVLVLLALTKADLPMQLGRAELDLTLGLAELEVKGKRAAGEGCTKPADVESGRAREPLSRHKTARCRCAGQLEARGMGVL